MWDWDPDRREELLQRLAGGGVRPEDVETIRAVLTSCRQIAEWTREEGMTVDRLRALVLGRASASTPAAGDEHHGGNDETQTEAP
jgi:hypothetical protein